MQAVWRALGAIQRTDTLLYLCGQPLVVAYYHVVSDDPLPHIKPLYPFRGVMQFEQDVETLCQHLMPISLAELVAHLKTGEPLPKPALLLTFDDGLRQCYTQVAPLLARKGIPAAFFLITACMDNHTLMFRHKAALLLSKLQEKPSLREAASAHLRTLGFGSLPPEVAIKQMRYAQTEALDALAPTLEVSYADYLKHYPPYLTWDEAREMQQMGFDFGAHSVDHPRFQQLDTDTQLAQVKQSMDTVQQQLNVPYRAFAFPFEDRGLPQALLHRLVSGPSPLVDVTFGTSGMYRERFAACLQRIDLERPKGNVRITLNTYLFKHYLRDLVGRTRMRRK